MVSGALEAGETVLAGVLREVREEIGEHARVRPLGALHTATFSYDENVPFMLSLCYLMAYEGGEIVPGDDMLGAAYRWVKPEEIETLSITSPANQRWLAERAVELYRAYTQQNVSLWHEMEIVP